MYCVRAPRTLSQTMPPATMRRSPRCLAGPADGYSEVTALAAAKRACSHTLGSVEDHAPVLSCNRSVRAAGAEPALLHSPPLINAVPRRLFFGDAERLTAPPPPPLPEAETADEGGFAVAAAAVVDVGIRIGNVKGSGSLSTAETRYRSWHCPTAATARRQRRTAAATPGRAPPPGSRRPLAEVAPNGAATTLFVALVPPPPPPSPPPYLPPPRSLTRPFCL